MRKSSYKGVSKRKVSAREGNRSWQSSYRGSVGYYATEKEAAKAYDIQRIRDFKDPVNILKSVID
jgi:hypothetical protein